MKTAEYTDESIKSLDWREHIRIRPGMYIGKLGDGSSPDDGIYVMVKEIIDNCIDEYVMGFGKKIKVTVQDQKVIIRDYGRGIPLGKLIDCVGKINTGGKYDSEVFKKSVGLNGVGTKAVNALSNFFQVKSFRDNLERTVEFNKGKVTYDSMTIPSTEEMGTLITFIPDDTIFRQFHFISEHLDNQIWNYAYLNSGLRIIFNGQKYYSKNGLLDFLKRKTESENLLYDIIHLQAEDIEISIVHRNIYTEQYYSFVNGQFTTQGGTHQSAFREAIVKTLRDFYNKNFDASDIRQSIVAAISIRVQEPIFESQTKTKLGSLTMAPEGITVRSFINDFIKRNLDNYLHKNPKISEIILKKILQSEKERKDMAGVRKLASLRAKKANLHNKKLKDCRVHLNHGKSEKRFDSTLFITEGDSASGSITKARKVETQAVFSLRGKPLNSFGLSKKIVYENEEFNLLQHALNIESGIEGLRYNNIVVATDADVDGMHIRLLLLTFFLQFFPDLIRNGHLYILETPLFRVRNRKKTIYCYSEQEKLLAIKELKNNSEITRFKGLGEISPKEFENFIGDDIKLEPVIFKEDISIEKTLRYYMGKNTPQRQQFIIENLRVETEKSDE